MPDKPIIFSGPMVRALLDGRKTQTRRPLKEQRHTAHPVRVLRRPIHGPSHHAFEWRSVHNDYLGEVKVPYAPGDRLYVREAYAFEPDGFGRVRVIYSAGGEINLHFEEDDPRTAHADRLWTEPEHTRPSIHMPRWASRLTLTVTEVRVQRLHEISEEDARAEGCDVHEEARPLGDFAANLLGRRASFIDLWNSLHGPDAWEANPWMVALTFTVERRNIGKGNK